jgi:hypothetical protein
MRLSRFRYVPEGRLASVAALSIVVATAGIAGAATVHRLAISQTTGSEGASATVQTSPSGGAFQGEVASHANSGIKIPFGVLGEYDASSSTFGIGVAGISTSGYGVGAEALGSSPAAVAIGAGSGDGADVIAEGAGSALSATGASASLPVVSITGTNQNTNLLSGTTTFSDGYTFTNFLITGNSLNRSGTATEGNDLELYGDIYLSGKVFQQCHFIDPPATASTQCNDVTASNTPGTSIEPTSDGRKVTAYASVGSSPQIDDVGDGRLANGSAYVRLDPTFARTIAQDRPYHVFLTPDGNSHGLYVTQKTPAGFVVHENDNGRSTLDFEYRIVAAPLGDRSAHLPAYVAPQREPRSRGAMPNPTKPEIRDLFGRTVSR